MTDTAVIGSRVSAVHGQFYVPLGLPEGNCVPTPVAIAMIQVPPASSFIREQCEFPFPTESDPTTTIMRWTNYAIQQFAIAIAIIQLYIT